MTTIIWVEDAGKIVNPSGIWSSYAKLHNENGPAVLFYDDYNTLFHKEYWLNSVHFTKIEYKKELFLRKLNLICD